MTSNREESFAEILNNWWQEESALDHCDQDVTTQSLISIVPELAERTVPFHFVAKRNGIFSGETVLKWIVRNQRQWRLKDIPPDGTALSSGQKFAFGEAPITLVLRHERMILNLIQHLCGIATATRELVTKVEAAWEFKSAMPRVLHTRKFLPGIRELQLSACLDGGGSVHRVSLESGILFKDNHKKFLRDSGKSLPEYYASLKKSNLLQTAMIEVENLSEALEAVQNGVQHLMLDNFTPEMTSAFFKELGPHAAITVELSGNLQRANLRDVLVDPRIRRLSYGALTHSVQAFDISLEVEK